MSSPVMRKVVLTQRKNVILLLVNIVGVVVFLWLGSWTWMPPEERRLGIHSVTGEPLIWAFSALPVLAIFFLVNVSWGAVILPRRQRKSTQFFSPAAHCRL